MNDVKRNNTKLEIYMKYGRGNPKKAAKLDLMELWGEYIRDGEQDQGNWLEDLTRWAEHVASPEFGEYHSDKLLTEVNRLKEAMNNG